MVKVPAEYRASVAPQNTRQGYAFLGSVKVGDDWEMYVKLNTQLQRKPEKADTLTEHKQKAPRPCAFWIVMEYDPEEWRHPKKIIVRVINPDIRLQPNWPPAYGHTSHPRSDPEYSAVTKFIPYDPEWSPDGEAVA